MTPLRRWYGRTFSALLASLATAAFGLGLGAAPALAAAAPSISEESALAGPNSAVLRAKVDPAGAEATCEVQYVEEAQYQSSEYAEARTIPCDPATLPASEEDLNVVAEVEGLTLDTGYHFRFVVENESGRAPLAGGSFTTFGLEAFETALLGSHGEPFTQAGGHPYEYTTVITITHGTAETSPSGDVKDVEVELPVGLIGNPAATARCTEREAEERKCRGTDQVGTAYVEYGEEGGERGLTKTEPLFNVVPPKGVAAELSARFNNFTNAFIDAHVRTGGDYGVDADSLNITSITDVNHVVISLWGVPAEESHDEERGCPFEGATYKTPCAERGAPVPFLSNPTSCNGRPLSETARADAWQAPGEFDVKQASMPATTGCEDLEFATALAVTPETRSTDSPTGLEVEVKVPQNEEPQGLATANLKDAKVSLPVGVTVNPSEASGLVGCPLLTGKESHGEQPGIDLENADPAHCPQASKIGTITLETPLIEHPLPGAIYIAQQGNAGPAHGSNPFGSLLAIYLAIEDPITGVIVKLGGQVSLDPVTGRLTTTFDENPQLPFETFKLDFTGGARAPLASPPRCGAYTTTSVFEPWSHEAPGEVGTPDAEPASAFEVTSMAGGGACSTPGFTPSLVVGTTDNQASQYSPLVTRLQRKDGEQAFKAVSVTLPKGVSGMISHVPLCGEAQADAGACPAASQIGHLVVKAGVGDEPIVLPEAGKQEDPVYLTGPYEGAPFGLAFVVHPEAGPFDLAEGAGAANEEPVVVRAKIEVDPHTAQVTIATPASGRYSMPTILQGVPVHLQSIEVIVDRSDFTFNPTSCNELEATGTIGSAEGATASVSSRFQTANCSALRFGPEFSASTLAKTSRKEGAQLKVKIGYPYPGEANIAKVKVQLPKDLPTNEKTLHYACPEAQFDANPAGCPEGSRIGSAIATTPVLKAPLSGPVYFVSHAAAKFPEVIAVLQGEGVTIDLAGETFISKKGITTSTFASVADEPVSSFEMTLPEGQYSALTAEGKDLCDDKLPMPTQITGQNGASLEQKTSIQVEGCPKQISFAGHKVKRRTAKVTVYVPSKGKLKASGRGVKTERKKAKGRGVVRLVLHEKKAGRLHTKVAIVFKPSKGGKQIKRLKLKFEK